MANAIHTLDQQNLTIGHAALGMRGRAQGTVREQVVDGDTISVRALGNFGVRLLGIDTPELRLPLPVGNEFLSIDGLPWQRFLEDPFNKAWPVFDPPLTGELESFLRQRVGADSALGHHKHAQYATSVLEREVQRDMRELGRTETDFAFFLVFAYDIMDTYGRLLCFINRDQPDPNEPGPRPSSYSERLLRKGIAIPYFIWPNVNPWRKRDSIMDAVLKPNTAQRLAEEDRTLRQAREWVQQARVAKTGIFDAGDPLRLEPFELRFLTRRIPPRRWVIDLSRNDDHLIRPQDYFTVPKAEDRLWIPEQYVPLFYQKGWKPEA